MAASWLKKGAASAGLAQAEKAQQAKQAESKGKLFRFWLKNDTDASITFLDGELSEDGFLLPPRFYEHNLQINGKWGNHVVCPEQSAPESGEKCPICETGDRPSLVALFTVIDHRESTGSNGKTYKDQVRLFVAKNQTYEILNKLAIKRGGLVGTRWDVSRSGDKSASVGNMFDYTDTRELDAIIAEYTRTYEADGKTITVAPGVADYEKEIDFKTGDELRAEGFGAAQVGVGSFTPAAPPSSQPAAQSEQPAAGPTDYSNAL